MRTFTILLMACAVIAVFVCGHVTNAELLNASETAQPKQESPLSTAAQMTAADVEALLEGIIPLQLERDNIAGATVAVVKDGKLLFAKGYGYADREKKTPVSADETLFRPGSVSKLFTWTAVMQLQEQGKLDLNRDVNEYLDFNIPDAYGQPITMKHILTHTAGFDEQIKDLFAADTAPPDLGKYLKTHIPTRVNPPGTTPSYSNYATALAGYIVERISGRPFGEYVNENIFKPLGMTHSTFAQPLPPEMAANMSNGYRVATDPPVAFEMVTAFPAGSLSSSATDMAKFMIAHLQEGQFGEARILKPETARLMHSRLFTLDDAAQAMAHGFYEESQNGHRIIGHGGDTIAFHSDLHLIPDTGVGFFVSYNSLGKGEASLRTILWDAFMDRYYPFSLPALPEGTNKAGAMAVAGNYMVSRRSETSFLRTASILGEATVVVNEDGTISTDALTEHNGLPKRWQETSPNTFRDVNGQDLLIFKPDANGAMQMIVSYPFMVFKRVGLSENSSILLPVLGLSLGIMALTLLLAPIAWFVRRHYRQKLELTSKERWLRRGVWIVFALNLICVIGLTSLITYAFTHIEMLGDGKKIWFYLFQAIGILGAIGTLLVLYNAFVTWMSSRPSIWSKLRSAIFVIACLGFLWFAFVGNLLIFRSTF